MRPNEKLQVAKQGVNLIHTIVDNNNCFFHEIQQENDVGVDAIMGPLYRNCLYRVNVKEIKDLDFSSMIEI
jgi:hypothetical protein